MKLKTTIQYLVVLICLGIIGHYFYTHKEELDIILHLNPKSLGLLSIIIVGIQILNALKYLLMLKVSGLNECKFFPWFKIFAVSNFANLIMPQGANIYRAIRLKSQFQFSYTHFIRSITFVAWFEIIAVLILTCITLIFLQANVVIKGINILHVILASIVIITLIPFTLNFVLSKLKYHNPTIDWMHGKANEITDFLTKHIRSLGLIFNFFILSALTYVLYLVCMHVGFQAMNIQLDLSGVALFTVIILLGNLVNIIPGNLGIMELMCGYLVQSMGEAMGSGIVLAGLLRILVYLVNILWAVIFSKEVLSRQAMEARMKEGQ